MAFSVSSIDTLLTSLPPPRILKYTPSSAPYKTTPIYQYKPSYSYRQAESFENAAPSVEVIANKNSKVTHVVSENDVASITAKSISAIFSQCDTPVNWIEVLSSTNPISDEYNEKAWKYLHSKAIDIFNDDINSYLDIIKTINPYDDLLDYAENFVFEAETTETITVEFNMLEQVFDDHKQMSPLMVQDFISAIAIRTARDTFALLPVDCVVVNACRNGEVVISVRFDRKPFSDVVFENKDASNIIEEFPHNMEFDSIYGLKKVCRI